MEITKNKIGIHIGHEYVDLGLSVKWATCNIGATLPQADGDLYAWGELEPKFIYSLATYKWYDASDDFFSKYYTTSYSETADSIETLDLEDDVAHVKWGGNWRIPTKKEWSELFHKCTWTPTSIKSVKGYHVTSKIPGYTDCSIFLPAAGYRCPGLPRDSKPRGEYWASTLCEKDENEAYNLSFTPEQYMLLTDSREFGRSIRPVCL